MGFASCQEDNEEARDEHLRRSSLKQTENIGECLAATHTSTKQSVRMGIITLASHGGRGLRKVKG